MESLFDITLHTCIIHPDYWGLSYIINLFIEKQGALSCEHYKGLKLQENVMKIL